MATFSLLRSVRQAGFTMIELLVVITMIGILATVMLAAINPIEQINKGRDTSIRKDADDLQSASDRYFASHEIYPWNEIRTGAEATPNKPYTPTAANRVYTSKFEFAGPGAPKTNPSLWNWIYQLPDTQEVKDVFATRTITESKLVLVKAAGSNATLYVCFAPASNAFRQVAAKNCMPGGSTPTVTVAGLPGGQATLCYTTNGTIPTGTNTVNYYCLP